MRELREARASGKLGLAAGLVVLAALAGGGGALAAAGDGSAAGSGSLSAAEQRDARIAAAIELRRELGLRADRAYVARLSASEGDVEQFGLALTDSERGALRRRERATQAVSAAVERYAKRHQSTFAGFFIDQDSGGVVRAGFTSGAADRLDALRDRVPFPARVDTFRADFSQRDLAGFARRVASDLRDLNALGVHQVAVDVARNAVSVEASDPSPGLEAGLEQRYRGAPIEVEASDPAELAANYERFQVPPMVGALQIFRNVEGGQVLCSAGFVGQARGSSRRSLITAGHCGDRGQRWFHRRKRGGTYDIGRVTRDSFEDGSTADAMLIARRGFEGAPFIYTPGRQAGRDNPRRQLRGIRSAQRKGGAVQGEIVCRSGWASDEFLGQGVFCGPVEETNVTALVFPGPVLLRRQVSADVNVCSGDSGGPVYKRHQAKGIVSAGAEPISPECSAQLLYSQIGFVEDRLDADVVTR